MSSSTSGYTSFRNTNITSTGPNVDNIDSRSIINDTGANLQNINKDQYNSQQQSNPNSGNAQRSSSTFQADSEVAQSPTRHVSIMQIQEQQTINQWNYPMWANLMTPSSPSQNGTTNSNYQPDNLSMVIRPYWIPDDKVQFCFRCGLKFSFFKRKHHCRLCGNVFCKNCCEFRVANLRREEEKSRVCEYCREMYINESNSTMNSSHSATISTIGALGTPKTQQLSQTRTIIPESRDSQIDPITTDTTQLQQDSQLSVSQIQQSSESEYKSELWKLKLPQQPVSTSKKPLTMDMFGLSPIGEEQSFIQQQQDLSSLTSEVGPTTATTDQWNKATASNETRRYSVTTAPTGQVNQSKQQLFDLNGLQQQTQSSNSSYQQSVNSAWNHNLLQEWQDLQDLAREKLRTSIDACLESLVKEYVTHSVKSESKSLKNELNHTNIVEQFFQKERLQLVDALVEVSETVVSKIRRAFSTEEKRAMFPDINSTTRGLNMFAFKRDFGIRKQQLKTFRPWAWMELRQKMLQYSMNNDRQKQLDSLSELQKQQSQKIVQDSDSSQNLMPKAADLVVLPQILSIELSPTMRSVCNSCLNANDILSYVKIKKLALSPEQSAEDLQAVQENDSASSILQSIVFDGFAITGSVAHKRMCCNFQDGCRIILLGIGALEFQRELLSSLDVLRTQEDQYLQMQVKKLQSQKPQVVVCESGGLVHGTAEKLLLQAGITLIKNVSLKNMLFLSRVSGAPVLPQVGYLDLFKQFESVGYIKAFRVQNLEVGVAYDANAVPAYQQQYVKQKGNLYLNRNTNSQQASTKLRSFWNERHSPPPETKWYPSTRQDQSMFVSPEPPQLQEQDMNFDGNNHNQIDNQNQDQILNFTKWLFYGDTYECQNNPYLSTNRMKGSFDTSRMIIRGGTEYERYAYENCEYHRNTSIANSNVIKNDDYVCNKTNSNCDHNQTVESDAEQKSSLPKRINRVVKLIMKSLCIFETGQFEQRQQANKRQYRCRGVTICLVHEVPEFLPILKRVLKWGLRAAHSLRLEIAYLFENDMIPIKIQQLSQTQSYQSLRLSQCLNYNYIHPSIAITNSVPVQTVLKALIPMMSSIKESKSFDLSSSKIKSNDNIQDNPLLFEWELTQRLIVAVFAVQLDGSFQLVGSEKPEFVCFNSFYGSSPVRHSLGTVQALLEDEYSARKWNQNKMDEIVFEESDNQTAYQKLKFNNKEQKATAADPIHNSNLSNQNIIKDIQLDYDSILRNLITSINAQKNPAGAYFEKTFFSDSGVFDLSLGEWLEVEGFPFENANHVAQQVKGTNVTQTVTSNRVVQVTEQSSTTKGASDKDSSAFSNGKQNRNVTFSSDSQKQNSNNQTSIKQSQNGHQRNAVQHQQQSKNDNQIQTNSNSNSQRVVKPQVQPQQSLATSLFQDHASRWSPGIQKMLIFQTKGGRVCVTLRVSDTPVTLPSQGYIGLNGYSNTINTGQSISKWDQLKWQQSESLKNQEHSQNQISTEDESQIHVNYDNPIFNNPGPVNPGIITWRYCKHSKSEVTPRHYLSETLSSLSFGRFLQLCCFSQLELISQQSDGSNSRSNSQNCNSNIGRQNLKYNQTAKHKKASITNTTVNPLRNHLQCFAKRNWVLCFEYLPVTVYTLLHRRQFKQKTYQFPLQYQLYQQFKQHQKDNIDLDAAANKCSSKIETPKKEFQDEFDATPAKDDDAQQYQVNNYKTVAAAASETSDLSQLLPQSDSQITAVGTEFMNKSDDQSSKFISLKDDFQSNTPYNVNENEGSAAGFLTSKFDSANISMPVADSAPAQLEQTNSQKSIQPETETKSEIKAANTVTPDKIIQDQNFQNNSESDYHSYQQNQYVPRKTFSLGLELLVDDIELGDPEFYRNLNNGSDVGAILATALLSKEMHRKMQDNENSSLSADVTVQQNLNSNYNTINQNNSQNLRSLNQRQLWCCPLNNGLAQGDQCHCFAIDEKKWIQNQEIINAAQVRSVNEIQDEKRQLKQVDDTNSKESKEKSNSDLNVGTIEFNEEVSRSQSEPRIVQNLESQSQSQSQVTDQLLQVSSSIEETTKTQVRSTGNQQKENTQEESDSKSNEKVNNNTLSSLRTYSGKASDINEQINNKTSSTSFVADFSTTATVSSAIDKQLKKLPVEAIGDLNDTGISSEASSSMQWTNLCQKYCKFASRRLNANVPCRIEWTDANNSTTQIQNQNQQVTVASTQQPVSAVSNSIALGSTISHTSTAMTSQQLTIGTNTTTANQQSSPVQAQQQPTINIPTVTNTVLTSSSSSQQANSTSQTAPSSFSVTVYYAQVFHYLRHFLCGGDLNFAKSLSKCNALKVTGGKSGASFLITQDGRYLIKETSKPEWKWIIQEDGAQHLLWYFQKTVYPHGSSTDSVISSQQEQKSWKDQIHKLDPESDQYVIPSLLTQIYGIFSVSYTSGSNKKTIKQNFVVLKNLKHDMDQIKLNQGLDNNFPLLNNYIDPIVFDLKGVGKNRRFGTQDNSSEQDSNANINFNDSSTLWDQNFREWTKGMPVTLRASDHTYINMAIHNDTTFLKQLGLMDYSLLVLIGRETQSVNQNAQAAQTSTITQTGLDSSSKSKSEKQFDMPPVPTPKYNSKERLSLGQNNNNLDSETKVTKTSEDNHSKIDSDNVFQKTSKSTKSSSNSDQMSTNLITMGIIDYLRPFTWDKQVETIAKSAVASSGQTPSVIEPTSYGDRLSRAVGSGFMAEPP